MKSTKLMLITILCLILSSLSGCKKDIVESLLKNNSYVECIINGKCARGEGLRTMFEAPTSFHMNYSYYDDGSFTFNIAKGINDKEGGNYRIYRDYRNWERNIISRNILITTVHLILRMNVI